MASGLFGLRATGRMDVGVYSVVCCEVKKDLSDGRITCAQEFCRVCVCVCVCVCLLAHWPEGLSSLCHRCVLVCGQMQQ